MASLKLHRTTVINHENLRGLSPKKLFAISSFQNPKDVLESGIEGSPNKWGRGSVTQLKVNKREEVNSEEELFESSTNKV